MVARAVFQDLRAHQIDVFMDVESIGGGQFDTIIKHQILARPYFLLILTPKALERCEQPGDWLLREIDHALETARVIVPIVTPEFSRSDIPSFLPGRTAETLARLNTVNLVHEYWEAAMDRLRSRFLVPLDVPTVEAPRAIQQETARKLELALEAPPVTEAEMLVQKHLELGWAKSSQDPEAAIAEFERALLLDPNCADAYSGRGSARFAAGEATAALADLDEAVRRDPQSPYYRMIRSRMRMVQGDDEGGFADVDEAVRLLPEDPFFRETRALAYAARDDFPRALADLTAAIGYGKNDAATYCRRGKIHYLNGDLAEAMADLSEALSQQPDFPQASYLRGRTRRDLGDPGAREDLETAAESDSAWGQRARDSIAAMTS